MARLYADENFDLPIVEALRQLGHDVLRAQEAGQGNLKIPDPQVLAFAISQSRAVLTLNRRDYFRLHRRGRPHCGIIACTNDRDAAALAARIDQAIVSVPNLDNQLLRIKRPSTP